MPPAGVLAAFAVAAMLYVAGTAVVSGVKKIGHGLKVGVSRLVHPHQAAAPDSDGPPADDSDSSFK